jgi:hypothetical protein
VQRERYLTATRAEKGALLNEVVTVTGLHRKAAIRLLRRPPRAPTARSRAGRPPVYEFVRGRRGRPACLGDLEPTTIQAWMDSMAQADLALSTMRVRQSTLSSLCAWLVKRGHLETNPVARLDRPPHRREAPRQVQGRPSWTPWSRPRASGNGRATWRSS